jgi:hypothetical protein
LQAGRTLNEVASQDKHVLNNIGALGGRLEDAGAVIRAQNKSCITGRVRLDRLSTLFFADLVYRLDLLEVLVGDCLCSDGSFPRDWSRPDVVLERQDICRRVERHGEVLFAGVNAWYIVLVSSSSIALGNSVLEQQEQPAVTLLGQSHLPLSIRESTGATSQSLPVAVIVGHFLIPSRIATNFLIVANPS